MKTERSEVSNASPQDELCLYWITLQSTYHVLRCILRSLFEIFDVTIIMYFTARRVCNCESDRREDEL